MCDYKDIKNLNENSNLQAFITQEISKTTNPFIYNDISTKIKDKLKINNVSEAIVESFIFDEMLKNTLKELIESDLLYYFNNTYIPINRTEKVKSLVC